MADDNRFDEILRRVMTARTNMMAKGLTRAKAKCPYCDGHWMLALSGPKSHVRMFCDGDCEVMMMQ